MKLILLSDFHLMSKTPVSRTDDAFITSFNKFNYIIDYANKNNAHIIQAGDLTHASRDYNTLHQLINSLSMLDDGLNLYTIWGQHNQYYRTKSNDATTLGILHSIKLLNILNKENTIIYDTYVPAVNVYGCSWGEDVPPPEEADTFNILAIHESIGTERLFPEDDPIDAEIFLREAREYNIILCGDIHRQFHIELDGRHILNTGCAFRYSGGEYELNHKPGFFLIDYDTNNLNISWEKIPHESSKTAMSVEHLKSEKYLNASVAEFINLVDEYQKKSTDPKRDIREYLHKNNISESIKNIIFKEMEND